MGYTQGYRDIVVIPDKFNTGLTIDENKLIPTSEAFPNWDGYFTSAFQVNYGTEYENILFENQMSFKSSCPSGVTFKNCKFTTNSNAYALIVSGTWNDNLYWNFINCEFEGFTSAAVQPQHRTKFINCKFHNLGSDGGKVTSYGGYENCYFYDIGHKDSAHADGIQTTGENNDFYIKNCRFDIVQNGNAGIFFIQEANSDNAVIKDVLINGGNYSFYLGRKDTTNTNYGITNLSMDNIKIGDIYHFGKTNCNMEEYIDTIKNAVSDQDKLFVSSVFQNNGKIRLYVTNYTLTERKLIVRTDKGVNEFMIPAHPSWDDSQLLTMNELPVDLAYEVDGNYVICYDTAISEENQIRYATFETDTITIQKLFKQICDAIREKEGTTDLINHLDIPQRILNLK